MAKITETKAPVYTIEVTAGELNLIRRALWLDDTRRDGEDRDENADLYNAFGAFATEHGLNILDC